MHLVLKGIALCGLGALVGCGTAVPVATSVAPVATASEQTAAIESAPEPPPPRRMRPAPRAPVETTSGIDGPSADSKPLVYNSPEWWAREKRREEDLNRKMNICRGC